MIQRTSLLALALALVAGSAFAACPQVQFRIWTDNDSTYYNHGDTITIAPGREAHLYIHHEAQGSNPFRTQAQIGHAADFGIRGVRNRGVVGFKRQSGDDRQAGRLVLTPKGDAVVTLGYNITGVSQGGVYDRLPTACRRGSVTIQVGNGGPAHGGGGVAPGGPKPQPNQGDAKRAAQQLSRGLHQALAPWNGEVRFDPREVDALLQRGRPALVDITTSILSSAEFRETSYLKTVDAHADLAGVSRQRAPRIGVVASRYLDDLYGRMWGGQRPSQEEHRSLQLTLMRCLDGEGDRSACQTVARQLVEHRHFVDHQRDALARLGR